MSSSSQGPLAGVRAIELGQIAAGPFAGSLLADLGADVIKIERPDGGDGMRGWPPLSTADGGEAPYSENFASLNRNKRSVVLDLKDRTGIERLLRLAGVADVLVENYRPGVLAPPRRRLRRGERPQSGDRVLLDLGLRPDRPLRPQGRVRRHRAGNERIDERHRRARRRPGQVRGPGRRFLRRALRGVQHHPRTSCGPGRPAGARTSTARCWEASSAWRRSRPASTSAPARRPVRSAPRIPRNAPYQAFRASDEHFIIAAGNDRLFAQVCAAVGQPELAEDPRFTSQPLRAEHQAALVAVLAPKFTERTAAEWIGEMDARGVPCAPINDYPRVFDDPQVAHLGLVHPLILPNGVETRTTGFPVAMSGYAFEIHRSPPALGAHTAEVLHEWLGEAPAPAEPAA